MMPAPYQMNFASARRQGQARNAAAAATPPPAVPAYGGTKPPAQQAPDPSQQFNQRGYPAPSRANLLPGQQTGFMQRMYGGMRGAPGMGPGMPPPRMSGSGRDTAKALLGQENRGDQQNWAPAVPGWGQPGGQTPGWQPDGSWYQPDDGGTYLQGGAVPGGGGPQQDWQGRLAGQMMGQESREDQQRVQEWSMNAMQHFTAMGMPYEQAQQQVQQQVQQYQQQKQQEIVRRMMGHEGREYAQPAAPPGWQQRMHGEMGGATSFSGGGDVTPRPPGTPVAEEPFPRSRSVGTVDRWAPVVGGAIGSVLGGAAGPVGGSVGAAAGRWAGQKFANRWASGGGGGGGAGGGGFAGLSGPGSQSPWGGPGGRGGYLSLARQRGISRQPLNSGR